MLITRPLVYTLLLFLVIVPSTALAENNTPGEIREVNVEMNPSSANYAMIAVPQYVPPDAPAPKKVIDKKFIAVMATLGGAESLRFTTHKLVLDHEYAAGAPWVTSVPSSPHLVLKYGGIYAAELGLAYQLKKPHAWIPGDRIIRKFWWAFPATMVPIHLKNGFRSIGTQPPSGCPVAECEQQ
ncbi:MAG: hypothetical protein WA172_20685 [Terriglobales bacterium]